MHTYVSQIFLNYYRLTNYVGPFQYNIRQIH